MNICRDEGKIHFLLPDAASVHPLRCDLPVSAALHLRGDVVVREEGAPDDDDNGESESRVCNDSFTRMEIYISSPVAGGRALLV